MANLKISQLTAATTLTGTELVPSVQSNNTVRTTSLDIANLTTHTIAVPVSSAEILSLNSSPKTLIAAPGAGKFINLVKVYLKYTFVAAAYTTNTTVGVYLNNVSGLSLITTYNILGNVSDVIARPAMNVTATGAAPASWEDLPVVLSASSNPTAGDSTLTVYLTYDIITI